MPHANLSTEYDFAYAPPTSTAVRTSTMHACRQGVSTCGPQFEESQHATLKNPCILFTRLAKNFSNLSQGSPGDGTNEKRAKTCSWDVMILVGNHRIALSGQSLPQPAEPVRFCQGNNNAITCSSEARSSLNSGPLSVGAGLTSAASIGVSFWKTHATKSTTKRAFSITSTELDRELLLFCLSLLLSVPIGCQAGYTKKTHLKTARAVLVPVLGVVLQMHCVNRAALVPVLGVVLQNRNKYSARPIQLWPLICYNYLFHTYVYTAHLAHG